MTKTYSVLVVAVLFVGMAVQRTEARSVYGTIAFEPLGVLFSPDIDGFTVSQTTRTRTGTRTTTRTEIEEIEGIGSWAPMLKAGLRFDANILYVDVAAGGGGLINGAFVAPLGTLEAAARFKLGRAVTLGPYVAYVGVGEPEWVEDADVTFSSTDGVEFGLGFTAGGRRAAFSASLGYLALSAVDVETGGEWTASDDELDLSGVFVKLGVRFFL